eukprot:6320872-Alexandrium_andersonii.AAC.1
MTTATQQPFDPRSAVWSCFLRAPGVLLCPPALPLGHPSDAALACASEAPFGGVRGGRQPSLGEQR